MGRNEKQVSNSTTGHKREFLKSLPLNHYQCGPKNPISHFLALSRNLESFNIREKKEIKELEREIFRSQ